MGKELTREDYVIILGDFGLVWDYAGESAYEKNWLDWLEKKPWTTLFIDGNHECFSRLHHEFPEQMWHGGKVHEIRPHILHLKRGEVFEIQGKTFFTFGGAMSHDVGDGILDPIREKDKIKEYKELYRRYGIKKKYRINKRSWWKEEIPSEEDMEHGLYNLSLHGNQVDYILTHECSNRTRAVLGFGSTSGRFEPYKLTNYFEQLEQTIAYRNWFFGHYHENMELDNRHMVLYDELLHLDRLIRLQDGPNNERDKVEEKLL